MTKTAIKERGWIAYQHEVKAILRNEQTMFRRVIEPQPLPGRNCVHFDGKRWYTRDPVKMHAGQPSIDSQDWACPYGIPGDRLWVREEASYYGDDGGVRDLIAYAADVKSKKGMK